MTIEIPIWLLWVIGVPLGILVLICAIFGALIIFGKGNIGWPG